MRARHGMIVAVIAIALIGTACGPDLPLTNASNDLYINAISLTGVGSGWAVGLQPGQNRAVLLHETNAGWQKDVTAPDFKEGEALKGIAVMGSTVWIAGSATDALHGDNSQVSGFLYTREGNGGWQRTSFSQSINAVAIVGTGSSGGAPEGWAVGAGGVIFHEHNGTWTQVPSPLTDDLYCVVFRSPTDGWAIGDMGAFLHYDGTSWQSIHLTHTPLYSIAVSADDGWIVGANGLTIRRQNGQWYEFTAPIYTDNRAVMLDGNGNGWIAGDHGAVFEFSALDQQWHHISPPGDVQLNTLAFAPDGTLWAGGNAGQPDIFAYNHGSWRSVAVALGSGQGMA
jgi:hypothetical protein